MSIAVYVVSIIGVSVFMSHFWQSAPTSTVLWIISGVCAIFSIYGGIIARSHVEDELRKSWLLAATVLSCLVLLGLTLSAIFLFVPAMS